MPEVQKARYAAALPLRPRRLGRDRAVRMRQERAADRLRRRKIPHQRALWRVRRRASGGVRRGPAARRRGHRPRRAPRPPSFAASLGRRITPSSVRSAQLQITAEKAVLPQGDAPEAFTDTVIMYEVLSELKEIAARPRGRRLRPAAASATVCAGASRRRRPHLRGLRREAAHRRGDGRGP